MFSWYKYLIVNLVFSHLGFWSGNFFLIAPFPDLCLLVLFLNRFYMAITSPSASAVVHIIQLVFCPRGESLTSQ